MKEDFSILREIDSLQKLIISHEVELAKELLRTEKIEAQIINRQQELDATEKELSAIEETMELLESDLESFVKNKNQKERSKNAIHTENEMATYTRDILSLTTSIETTETKQFELLESKENLEAKATEARNFLQGASESLSQIEEEVGEFQREKLRTIQSLKERILGLEETLSDSFQEKWKAVSKKKFTKSALSRVEAKSCSMCGASLDAIKADQIENKHEFKTCSQCSRVLMPASSFY